MTELDERRRAERMEAVVARLIDVDDRRRMVAEPDAAEGQEAVFSMPLVAEYNAAMFELRQLVELGPP
jgi:hypothetical protein